MATYYGVNAGGNWDAGATWSVVATKSAARIGGAVAPTASDNCILDDYSGSVTNTGFGVCRSLDCTGYTGTLTLNASQELRFGDATGGPSNKTLVLVAGMTLTAAASSIMGFVTGSGSVQTINFASKTTGNVTFNATGSYQLLSGFTCPATSTVTLTKGTLDINGQTCSWGLFNTNNSNTRSLTLGAAAITITGTGTAWNASSTATVSAASSTITFTGNSVTMTASSHTYGTVIFTGGGPGITSSGSFGTLTKTGTASKTDSLILNSNITVSGTLTINGNSTINRVLCLSNTVGTARTITAATVSCSNTDFQDITGAGAGSWDFSASTTIGDCQGNSGITFPASVTCLWDQATGGNWSDVTKWTNTGDDRVPLPQDDVSFANAFSASQTVTADMPRLGRSIDWTGATGSPTFSTTVGNSIYGSHTLVSGMTYSASGGNVTYAGRGTYSITSSGVSHAFTTTFNAVTGTYSLNDAFSQTVGGTGIVISNGSFNSNNFNISCVKFTINGSVAKTITLGTSTITTTITSAVSVIDLSGSNLTFSALSSTINITGVSASTRTFTGSGYSYGTLTYTVAGSTGELDITGSNSFAAINFSDVTNARSLKFTNGTITTIRNGNGFNVRGTSGKLMTIDTITGASTFTLTSPNQQSTDYITPTRSTVDASPKWYAGANSTDGTGNTNWVFSAAPLISSSRGMFSKSTQSLQNLCRL